MGSGHCIARIFLRQRADSQAQLRNRHTFDRLGIAIAGDSAFRGKRRETAEFDKTGKKIPQTLNFYEWYLRMRPTQIP